ncbi:MAG: hypothetical protein ACI3W5_09325 [Faecousia sp.]
MDNNCFQRLRQFHNDLPAQWYAYTRGYFYIYSNQSFMDYTILVKVSITKKNRVAIDNFTEALESGTYEHSKAFNSWTSHFRRGKGRYSWDSIRNGNRGTAVRSDGMDGGKRDGKNSENSEKSSGNKPKVDFSREALDSQGREPLVDGEVNYSRNGHWVPNLTKQEKSRVEYLINNNRGTQLTSNSNVFSEKSKGNILFGICITDDNTLLYVSIGRKANNEHLFTKMAMEEYENERVINGRAEDAHTFVERIRMQQTASSVNGSGIGASRGYAGNGRVHGVPSGRNTSPALRSVLANIFSAETGRRTGERTVKTSREALDTQGRELSKAQQEYFKDSKVRNENAQYIPDSGCTGRFL